LGGRTVFPGNAGYFASKWGVGAPHKLLDSDAFEYARRGGIQLAADADRWHAVSAAIDINAS
jgi:hypothetical protein